MGWGVTRQRVYNLLVWIICQTRECEDSSGQPVSGIFCPEVVIELIITSASTWAYHSMDGGDDQTSRRRCNRQGYSWSSVRECISAPYGMTNFHIPLLKAHTPSLDCAVLYL